MLPAEAGWNELIFYLNDSVTTLECSNKEYISFYLFISIFEIKNKYGKLQYIFQ
jgi:hypothetical protein